MDSEYESAKTSTRGKRNTAANAATGKPHGRVLYGYVREYDPATRAFLRQVVDAPKAEIVREAARRIASGDSCYGIARDFNTDQVPVPHRPSNPRNFPEWNGAQIKRMVTNPGYIGKRVHRGEVVGDAVWPAILDEETFYTCARILNDPARKRSKDGAIQHLLSGIATCGECGRILRTGRQSNGATPYKTYVCKNWCASRRVEYLNEFVEELAIERLSRPDLLAVLTSGSDGSESALAEIAEKRLRLQEVETEISAGGRAVVILSRVADDLLEEIENLESKIKRASVSPAVGSMMGPDAREKWESASIPRKREILRALFSELAILRTPKGRQGRRGFDPSLVRWDFFGTDFPEDVPTRRTVRVPANTQFQDQVRDTKRRAAVDAAPLVPVEQQEAIKRALNS